MGELVFLLVIAALAIGMFVMTFSFPTSIVDKSGGPALFPRILIGLLLLLLIIRFIQILKGRKEKFYFLEFFTGNRLIVFLSLVFLVASMSTLGYVISTSLFVLGLVNLFYAKVHGQLGGLKKIIIRNISLLVLVVGVYWFFLNVLHITLPQGIFF